MAAFTTLVQKRPVPVIRHRTNRLVAIANAQCGACDQRSRRGGHKVGRLSPEPTNPLLCHRREIGCAARPPESIRDIAVNAQGTHLLSTGSDGEQETISARIVEALGSPRGFA